MRRNMMAVCLVGLLLPAGALAQTKPKAAARADEKKLQGNWAVASCQVNGVTLPQQAFAKVVITIAGNQMTFRDGDKVYDQLTFTLDPSTRPRSMDLTHTLGLKKGTKDLGIYEIRRTGVKICYTPPRLKRPTDFTSDKGSGNHLFVLERKK